jgi:hypothetical protein
VDVLTCTLFFFCMCVVLEFEFRASYFIHTVFSEPGTVTYVCNSSYSRGGDGE